MAHETDVVAGAAGIDQRGGAATALPTVPNFFIVGAPKCATTSMDAYLAAHPEIYMAPRKEPHFFARDLYPEGVGCSAEAYGRLFEGVAGEPVVGESSVFYMLSQTAARAIHDARPDAKILIMLRDPIEVLASHHSQIIFEGLEDEPDLARALALEAARRARHGAGSLTYQEKVLHYRDVVAFADQVARFQALFPPEQIKVVLFEDVKADLPGVYGEILAFLGVDPTFQPTFKVQNANKRLRSARLGAFLRETPGWVTALGRVVLPSAAWRYKTRMFLKRLNTDFRRREPMAPALRAHLAAELDPQVRRLEALLDRDLSHWARARRD
ncbi:hypothetical protein CCR85_05480 [Rhodothalassium salexigens]|uniref:sulfotransferase family protein n=1 Tax=Rhodothalassium salexigens TaxID=1086 RepID=UPI0019141DCD|nr:sulfotransferase [Rhodothalassium salexigens]MBK5910944.1 hypothetical protein [Rhodothalassium salexigens]MBK5921277.1 hypothetical protein [Rhodothalassium salexigens]